MANSDVPYKDPIDEVTMAKIHPHIKSAVDEIKDQCDSILEQTGMWADFTGNRRAAQKAALELQKSCTAARKDTRANGRIGVYTQYVLAMNLQIYSFQNQCMNTISQFVCSYVSVLQLLLWLLFVSTSCVLQWVL